jgi:hypothetical protein
MLWWRRIPSFGRLCSELGEPGTQVDMIFEDIDRPVTHEHARIELGVLLDENWI